MPQVEKGMVVRVMSNGSTLHGSEMVAPHIDVTPNTYYHPQGPLGDIMAHHPPHDVGVIGMGTGATVCYQALGRSFTFYEINAVVPALAEKWFHYTRQCGAPRVVIGDGRKGLAETRYARYDLLIVDAFTSDAIPVHLLTKEALEEYKERLQPDGLLAFHVSNRFYDLRPPLSNVAKAVGLHALYKFYITPDEKKAGASSDWVLMARDPLAISMLRQKGWWDLPPPEGRVWTDDYSNLLTALKQDW